MATAYTEHALRAEYFFSWRGVSDDARWLRLERSQAIWYPVHDMDRLGWRAANASLVFGGLLDVASILLLVARCCWSGP